MFGFLKRDKFPAVIHFTHAKAGSTWIDGILRALFGKRVLPRFWSTPDFTGAAGKVYASVFMERDAALQSPDVQKGRRFFVLRDLRDTLISRYFSIRDSHKPDPAGKIEAARAELLGLSVEDGLSLVMDDAGMAKTAAIQRSWLGSSETVLRYEDLITNDVPLFTKLFTETLALPVTAADVEKAVVSQRFETVYGRKLGEEDTKSHGRKGTPGDWQNHFTRKLAEKFHGKFGELLIQPGYERDAYWGPAVA
jgi:hypothetical protein